MKKSRTGKFKTVIANTVKQSQRIISTFLVFAFTATSVPCFGDSPPCIANGGVWGQSLLAPASRFTIASKEDAIAKELLLQGITWADFENIKSAIGAMLDTDEKQELNKGGRCLHDELVNRGIDPFNTAQLYPIASAFIKLKAEEYIDVLVARNIINEKKGEAARRFIEYLIRNYIAPDGMKIDIEIYYKIISAIGNNAQVASEVAYKTLKTIYPSIDDSNVKTMAQRMEGIFIFLRRDLGEEYEFGDASATAQMLFATHMVNVIDFVMTDGAVSNASSRSANGSREGGFILRKHLIALTVTGLLLLAGGIRLVHDIRKEMARDAYFARTRIVLELDEPAKGKEITIPMLIEDLKKKSGYDWIPATLALIKKGQEAVPYLLAALELEKDKSFRAHVKFIISNIEAEEAKLSASRSGGSTLSKLLLTLTSGALLVLAFPELRHALLPYIAAIFGGTLAMAPISTAGFKRGGAPRASTIGTLIKNLDAAIRSDKPDDIVRAVWPLILASRRKKTAPQAIVAVPILVNLISRKKSTAGVRRYVIHALGEMCEKNVVNDPALVSALINALLTDEDATVREKAAEALGKIKMAEKPAGLAIEALASASSLDNETNWRVRFKAVEALGRRGLSSELARSALEKAFREDPQITVRRKADKTITALPLSGVLETSRGAATSP